MPVRTASAEWKGDLPKGKGTMKTDTGSFDGQYSFSSRFEEGTGTNPVPFSLFKTAFIYLNNLERES